MSLPHPILIATGLAMKQLNLLKTSSRKEFGGSTRIKKRKEARPLDRGKSLHLVMRSAKARGKLSMRLKAVEIEQLMREFGRRYGMRIERLANVGNHLHVLMRFQSRRQFQLWLKCVTGKIARLVTGARKGRPFGKFWDGLAYTRVVSWGRDERYVRNYIIANCFEANHGRWVKELFLWQQQPLPDVPKEWGFG